MLRLGVLVRYMRATTGNVLCHQISTVYSQRGILAGSQSSIKLGYIQSSESDQKPRLSARPEPAIGCLFKTAKEELVRNHTRLQLNSECAYHSMLIVMVFHTLI
uniref:Uncharacterized protein n=1 Tax=Timema shepardi TaxID=629360 RepID=A0A7R9G5L6_TIMSH|nr:unnamed protein product [Timema shepardi]